MPKPDEPPRLATKFEPGFSVRSISPLTKKKSRSRRIGPPSVPPYVRCLKSFRYSCVRVSFWSRA